MIRLDTAREQIEPIEALLIDAHNMAAANWRKLLEEFPALALPLSKTSRANFLHDHITAQVSRGIEGNESVKSNDKLDFFGLLIGRAILLRFKYVGNDGTPHNVDTARQRRLARQVYTEDEILLLTGDIDIAPPTLLTCGYTLTDTNEIGRMEVMRECTGHETWSYDIHGGARIIEPLYLDGMADDDAKPARVSSSRKADEEGEGQAEGA